MKSLKSSQLQKNYQRTSNDERTSNNIIKILREYYVIPVIQGYPKLDSPYIIHSDFNLQNFALFN